jgi:type IV pilus assembly protein PilW
VAKPIALSGTHNLKRAFRGFSLIELMVGMVIALLGSLVIFQVFAVSESYKRSATSGGDAQENGAGTLFMLERDLRQAGYGVNNRTFLGCSMRAYDSVQGGNLAARTFAPVSIAKGVGNTPDTVTIMFADADLQVAPTGISQNMASAADSSFRIQNRYGFAPGNLVLAAEPGLDCTLAQVTGLPTAPNTDVITRGTGTYTTLQGATLPVRYNSAAGLGVSYSISGTIFNLGDAPAVNTYSVDTANNTLVVRSWLSGAQTVAAEGIVSMRAQYGKDTDGDNVVDTFDNTTPTTAAGWAQVLAVRIAVVARSNLLEKTKVTDATSIKLWPDSTAAPTTTGPTYSLNDPDKYYRYKTFETIVPLRNMLWQ